MQAIAAWLVARPINAPLALALTVSAGVFSILSGVILVLLVLRKGPRSALIDLAWATPAAAVIGLLYQVPLLVGVGGAIAIWLPAMLLSVILIVTRSITLTLQLSVIFAVVVVIGVYLVFGNPVGFWIEEIARWAAAFRGANQPAFADWLEMQQPIAEQMTMIAVFAHWFRDSIVLVLGYKLYRALPDETPVYGRFRDLNLGRVIALILATVSVAWMLTDLVWLQSVSFVVFGAFWLQGLAMVHWLYGEEMLPKAGIVVIYVMLLSLMLSAVTVLGLAIFGYLDAWFKLRRLPKVPS